MAQGGAVKIDVEVTGYWQLCPVCCGRGWVPPGFYGVARLGTSTSDFNEQCRRCVGTGTIETPAIRDAIEGHRTAQGETQTRRDEP